MKRLIFNQEREELIMALFIIWLILGVVFGAIGGICTIIGTYVIPRNKKIGK